jgi:Saccharopine dehydrogenase NADP binding domain
VTAIANMAAVRTIMVLGGYGLFGKRVCAGLLRIDGVKVLVAGRDANAARAFASTLGERAEALQIDWQAADFSERLAAAKPQILIHCAGPFQAQDYRVANAAIAIGAHYIDLADGRDFVRGIDQLHAVALAKGLAVISGASSVPALSSSVLTELTQGWQSVAHVDIGISPGNKTERGLATIRAILSYVGEPIPAWQGGKPARTIGWQGLRRFYYPKPAGKRWLVNCDVPDLTLLPVQFLGLKSLQFGAGLELSLLHIGLWLLAGLRRYRLLPNLAKYASFFKSSSELFLSLGSDVGAMHVTVKGTDAQANAIQRTWTLVARLGHGTAVPAAASIAIARALVEGNLPCGARPAVAVLPLQHYLAELQGFDVQTEIC